jgi:signal transduction histidine kinase/CheY-like chemotaxis protein
MTKMETRLTKVLLNPVLILGLVFIIISTSIFYYLNILSKNLIENYTIQSARQYSEVLTAFRTLYTSEVVTRALEHGMEVSHDYRHRDNSIPLPATLSMLLGEKMGVAGLDVKTKLYSAHPFPWRRDTGGLRDGFARDAWAYLRLNPGKPYIVTEEINDLPTVRYAVADLMREKCVNCHNSHPDTPKTGWKVGDVRGVLEVTLPLHSGLAGAQQISVKVVILVALMLVATLAIVAFLSRSLFEKHRQTQSLNEELQQEVEVRQQAEREANLANQTKTLFLANISHEIRTPMNAILGYSQIIRRDKNLTHEQRHSLSIMERSGEHLLGLINDVLDISKIESGILELHENEFDLYRLLNGIADMFRLKAQQKGLHWGLYLDFPFNQIWVLGDEGKLRQILINLIGNAVKFTDSGFVRLKAELHPGDEFFFEITDSGAGIDSDELSRLFTPFSQGRAGLTKGGTGLGLSITQTYLQLMNSKMTVSRMAEHGTCIQFTLNLPVMENPERVIDVDQQVKCIAAGQTLTIMVVDDIKINRDVLSKLLTNIGIKVQNYENGADAIAALDKARFDAIFTDIDMPGVNGYDLLNHIRRSTKHNQTPVIAISASTIEQNKHYFTKQGFAGFISKPFLIKDIFSIIAEVTGIRFEYDSPQSEIQAVTDIITLPSSPVMEKIRAAAELSYISEIDTILNSLSQQAEYQAFVARLRKFMANYDMDGLLAFLHDAHASKANENESNLKEVNHKDTHLDDEDA